MSAPAHDQESYRQIMSQIAGAAMLLEEAEPTMAKLLKQISDVESFGFVFNPTLARDVIADRDGRLKVQRKLAQAVVAFVATWRELREEASAAFVQELERASAKLEAEAGDG
jgi:hypothetical protein